MNTHTPGPWTTQGDSHQLSPHPYHEYRFIVSADGIVARMSDSPTQKADARLIAATPDLLEALQQILVGFEHGDFRRTHPRQADDDPYHPALVAARAAIAKATGEEPQP